ncbi:hypothetical protein MA16_Dca012090 [Dendrobium catenatum]|uniref:PATROL1-like C-terminal domain-containing protein n=1 Tax=Dendrobium catenatum TaxID=906689 RepID=A0A2I0WW68_9ASPA|nr:hypothetical protein MA16_Dca012090 [Dendrobium catenatum]
MTARDEKWCTIWPRGLNRSLRSIPPSLLHAVSDFVSYDVKISLFLRISDLNFVAGNRQTYMPFLPPLTRCNQDSKLTKLWKKAKPCTAGMETGQAVVGGGGPIAGTPSWRALRSEASGISRNGYGVVF